MATEVLRGCSTATEGASVASPLITETLTLREVEERFPPAVVDAIVYGFQSAHQDPDDLAAPFQNYVPERRPRLARHA